MIGRLVFILLLINLTSATWAHEIRPAYLQITETAANEYEVIWKVPVFEGRAFDISPAWSALESQSLISEKFLPDALIRKYQWVGSDKIGGSQLSFPRLSATLIDVIIYIKLSDDISYTLMAQPESPSIHIPVEPNPSTVIVSYLKLGIEHILMGFDHLLFVLCLILLIQQKTQLIKTITSFTLAHSITLAMSALGWFVLPSPPVEAVIALSIMFLAREYYFFHKGGSSLTVQYPWSVAFIFGLLHGLGFAGALTDIGLPQSQVPLSLLFFNVGVEVGQLAFIALMLILGYFLSKILIHKVVRYQRLLAFSIGGTSTFWLIERLAQF
jgi:hydrogenase/urease accessory protein HupE